MLVLHNNQHIISFVLTQSAAEYIERVAALSGQIVVTTTIRLRFNGRSTTNRSRMVSNNIECESINQSINIRLIKVVRRNLKQLKYWQCIYSIK